MGKRACGDRVARKGIAHVRRAETVPTEGNKPTQTSHVSGNIPNASVLRLRPSILVLHGLDPSRNGFVRERSVLFLPGLVVKVWIGFVVAVLAVFPDGVLIVQTA